MFNLYHLIAWVYEAAPIVSLGWTIVLIRRTRSVKPLRTYIVLLVSGLLMGIGVILLRESLFGRIASYGEFARAGYWMTGLAWILRSINVMSEWILVRVLRSRVFQRASAGKGIVKSARRATRLTLLGGAALSRALIVFSVGVGLLLASLLGYRPGFASSKNPTTILQAPYETVALTASDGTRLSAWWIPAMRSAMRTPRPLRTHGTAKRSTTSPTEEGEVTFTTANARDTILLCHGLGSDKAEQLPVVRGLYAAGYNVMTIDFRAHGQSGGAITTFGTLERLDVLAAVHWLRTNQPQHAKRILGLGINLGSAALLGAAADPGDDGQAIDAIAAIEPFDHAGAAMQNLGSQLRLPALGWLAAHVGLPALRAEFGAVGWSPVDNVGLLWPRPLFIVQGNDDGLVPAERARALFDNALQPKYAWWVDRTSTRQILFKDPRTSLALRAFFGGARSIL